MFTNGYFENIRPADLPAKSHTGFLSGLLYLYQNLAKVMATAHSYFIRTDLIRVPTAIEEAHGGTYTVLWKLWKVRMLRRTLSLLLRTPLRYMALPLVKYRLDLPEDKGCIIALCHTPWARLLARWCRTHDFALVFAGGPWKKRTGRLNIPGGSYSGIRRLIRHLKKGGLVIVMGDNTGWSCCTPVSFMGKEQQASVLPARLAALAEVPIAAVVPHFRNNRVYLDQCLILETEKIKADRAKAIQNIFSYYEEHILHSPFDWGPPVYKSLGCLE